MPVDAPPRQPSIPADDVVVVFRTQNSNIRGRLVRLGATLDAIVAPHAMPELPGRALSEALALAALCGSALPKNGNLNLMVRSDGAVSILVADYAASGKLRGYARFDAEKIQPLTQAAARPDIASALGSGHLAITLDSGPGEERYQGVLAFEDAALSGTVAAYFQQRENLPTFIRSAVAEQYVGSRQDPQPQSRWHWRAGGLMVQSLSASTEDGGADDDDWKRVEMLAATVEDHELLDPGLTVERLLLRLFHEEAVSVERIIPLSAFCRCSREKVENVLSAFGAGELSDMLDDSGQIVVTCEFCTKRYVFSPNELRETGS
ncbi:MAG: Hsp33 family molecular chaperone HslO [Hyphomicrobium sp.]|uniref:Hsp33 family molecular chaperone HslO n=1 Tax=Hyphomicrobium sp. TaxID=82 RepID=UPI0039E29680